ncbi:SDR family NAD(P)-dependent oxidoreductase [Natrarchaeobius halalkaliphilus]|uniref:SDR family NAD(P)-dependent oxidoreductase n=1 Tax=Natrarchaeobius halalkaliphilus TaxID=1679091 RepID=A0A3N6LK19_9EURY|nr:SDR family NAD(P)-dependent oxidoreductase [Natrarchaeobius halalkaliphilus]RQG86698.1 SDR family NAD(P)-dependent oxidoreductase [Natrarchaeobius halalkaliphilus]
MSWLDNRVVLVTGGASGLGRAVVRRFVEEGASVGILDVSADGLADLSDEFGDSVVTSTGDVTRLSDNEDAVERTVDAFGKLDVFVGNAGVFDDNVTIAELPDDDEAIADSFRDLFEINVLGYLLGAKAALPELVETNGRMVFTASGASFEPDGGGSLYVPSKHAIAGIVRQLAFELSPSVSVNAVAPGYVPTNLSGIESLEREEGGVLDESEFDPSVHPAGIVPTPADYTGAYVLLASEENSRPMTGTIVRADLGRNVRGIGNVSGRALEFVTDGVDTA